MESPDETSFYSRVAAKLTPQEIEFMNTFEIDDGTGLLSLGEFIILMTVRMGSLAPSVITKLNQYFKQLDVNDEGRVRYIDMVGGRRISKLLALPGMVPPDLHEILPEVLLTAQLINERGHGSRSPSVVHPIPDAPPVPNPNFRLAALANRRASITARRASVALHHSVGLGGASPSAVVPVGPELVPAPIHAPASVSATGWDKQQTKTTPALERLRSMSTVEEFMEEGRLSTEELVERVGTVPQVPASIAAKPEEEKCDDDVSVSKWLMSTFGPGSDDSSSDSKGYEDIDSMFDKLRGAVANESAQSPSSCVSSSTSSDSEDHNKGNSYDKDSSDEDMNNTDSVCHIRSPTVVASPTQSDNMQSDNMRSITRLTSGGKQLILTVPSEDSECSSPSSSMRDRKIEHSMRKSISHRSSSVRRTGSFRSSKTLRNKDMSERIKKVRGSW